MASQKQHLEKGLANLRSKINTADIERLAGQLQSNTNISIASQLSQQLGQTIPGFLTLATTVDDIVPQVAGSFPNQTVGHFGIVQLTDALPEIGSQMSANGSLDVVISAPFPQAVAAATQRLTNSFSDVFTPATTTQLENLASKVVNISLPLRKDVAGQTAASEGVVDDFETMVKPNLTASLKGVIGNVIGVKNQTRDQIVDTLDTQMTTGVNKINASINFGFGSLLQNLSENLFHTIRNQLNKVTRIGGVLQSISDSDLRKVVTALEANKIDAAVSIVKRYSDMDEGDIYNALKAVDSTILSAVAPKLPGGISGPPVNKVNTFDNTFQIIHNKNALISEFQSIRREVTVLVLTHTTSYNNQNLTARDIDVATSPIGGIPYHYVIRRDGVIERGRAPELPATTLTDHPQYNKRSLLVALVGGIDAPKPLASQTPNPSGARRSFTRLQWESLRILVNSAYIAYPGMQVVGRNQFGDGRSHPGFDVEEYIEILGKQNIINPQIHTAPTRLQIRNNQPQERNSNAPEATLSRKIGPR